LVVLLHKYLQQYQTFLTLLLTVRGYMLNFDDVDSTGLEPSSGLELRFSVTKITGATATTVTPSSTFIDSSSPKTLQLNFI